MPVIEHFPFIILIAPSIRLETKSPLKKADLKSYIILLHIINMHRKVCLIDQG